MKFSTRKFLAFSIIPQFLLVQWAARSPAWVETVYSRGIYPYISSGLRWLYGWAPFSIGDLLYTGLGIAGMYYGIRGLRSFRKDPGRVLTNLVGIISLAYFSFHLLWALNYHRQPLAEHLDLQPTYTEEELLNYTGELVNQLNMQHGELSASPDIAVDFPFTKEQARKMSIEGFRSLEALADDFTYRVPSLKNSLYSRMLSIMGYGGYLNPFTNEAQVNGKLPLFRYTVVCGHEIGHQLGYSKENETNFIGYLVARNHRDPYFQYSATAYALAYTLGEVGRRDKQKLREFQEQLNPGVRKNYEEIENFWKSYANPAEPVFKSIFDQFLRMNRQKEGIRSYNRVVGLMIAYHRKESNLAR